MIDAYVSALPASALGPIGSSLVSVGVSLVVGVAISAAALALGAVVQRVLDAPVRRRADPRIVARRRPARAA
jgi:hypothetical protein